MCRHCNVPSVGDNELSINPSIGRSLKVMLWSTTPFKVRKEALPESAQPEPGACLMLPVLLSGNNHWVKGAMKTACEGLSPFRPGRSKGEHSLPSCLPAVGSHVAAVSSWRTTLWKVPTLEQFEKDPSGVEGRQEQFVKNWTHTAPIPCLPVPLWGR